MQIYVDVVAILNTVVDFLLILGTNRLAGFPPDSGRGAAAAVDEIEREEHDEIIETFRKQEDGSYLIACSANLDDMYDLFEVKGQCDAATVSGWVMEQVGRVPEEGDHFQAEGLDVTVTKVEHRRVLEVRVQVLPEEDAEEK